MKTFKLTLALILFSVITYAQCDRYVFEDHDKMTGKTSITAKKIVVSKDSKKGFAIYLLLGESAKTLAWSTTVVGASACINDDGTMLILFKDGSRLELANDTGFNCDGDFVLYFGEIFGKQDALEQLTQKDIAAIRVWTAKGYVEEDFSATNAKAFKETVNCLIEKLGK